jgi:hypothetical protein
VFQSSRSMKHVTKLCLAEIGDLVDGNERRAPAVVLKAMVAMHPLVVSSGIDVASRGTVVVVALAQRDGLATHAGFLGSP